MNNAPAAEQCDTDALTHRQLEIVGKRFIEMAFLLEQLGTQTARDEALKLRRVASRIALFLDGDDHE